MIEFDKKLVRILVCDDEASIRDVVGMTLKDDGWTVELAENGKAGLELIQAKPFHIVLTDIQMPEMTGIELLEAAKKHNPSIEFVIMTSNATLETALQALKLGAYDYLHKPFEDLAMVPQKMTHAAEKIFLRQQNHELLKRLKKSSQDLKRLYAFTRSLNAVLERDKLQKICVEGITPVFDTPGLRCAWLTKEIDGWSIKGEQGPLGFEIPSTFADLEALKTRAHPSIPLLIECFPTEATPEIALVFDAPNSVLSALMVDEVKTCFAKVKMHEETLSLANRDGLTKLYNHRYFQDRLSQELAQVKRQHSALSVILMDVDNFKHYNDTHGHPAGDKLLIELSRILETETGKRASDIVARYGGEEFVMVLPFTPHEGACKVAERVRELIASYAFDFAADQPLGKVSVSVGVATYPDQADQQSKLIELADRALYMAKKSGRDRVASARDLPKEVQSVETPVVEAPVVVESVVEVVVPEAVTTEPPQVEPPQTEAPSAEVHSIDVPEVNLEAVEALIAEVKPLGDQVAKQTLAAVLEAPDPVVEAKPPKSELPDVFDVSDLIQSVDEAFITAEAKAAEAKIEAKTFGPEQPEAVVSVDKKENSGG